MNGHSLESCFKSKNQNIPNKTICQIRNTEEHKATMLQYVRVSIVPERGAYSPKLFPK